MPIVYTAEILHIYTHIIVEHKSIKPKYICGMTDLLNTKTTSGSKNREHYCTC